MPVLPPVRVRSATTRDADDGVALIAVVATLLLVVPLSLAALAIVIQRQKGVVYERSRTFTAHAAEAGLDGATAALRAASSGGAGVRTELPCAGTTPLTGSVGDEAPGLRYSVRVRYYLVNPAGRAEAWRTANELPCTPGQGVARTPSFALLESAASGSQTAGSYAALRERSLESVYRFDIDNENIGGGLVRTRAQNNAGAVDLCWAAAGTPVTGVGVRMAACEDGSPQQMLAYRADHTLYLVSAGLCLQTSGATGTPLTFERCDGSPRQVWVYDTSDHIRAADATATGVAGACIGMQDAYVDGTPVVLSPDCGSAQTQWSPESRTGPGGAGDSQLQLVNFAEFARCFDVTDVNWGNYFMQLHPCKQSLGALDWPPQQLTYVAATGQYRFGNPGDMTTWCLTAPDPAGGSEYVTTTTCDASAALQRWTRTGDTGAYDTSYTIIDSTGRCLAEGPVPPDPGRTFSAIVVAPCDGSTAQKWNAPPQLVHAGVEGFQETTGG
jgi:hypothetical protein